LISKLIWWIVTLIVMRLVIIRLRIIIHFINKSIVINLIQRFIIILITIIYIFIMINIKIDIFVIVLS